MEILGQLLALVTAACWAGNSVTYKFLGTKMPSDSLAFARMLLAFPAILILTLLVDKSLPLHSSTQTYIALLASGAIGYFVTDLLMFRAYMLLGARESLVIMTLAPVCTSVLSYYLFGQALSLLQIGGILLIIAGIVTMVFGEVRKRSTLGTTSSDRNVPKGLMYAILGAVLQSVSYILAAYALSDIPPVSSNLVRNAGGLLAFLLYWPFIGKRFTSDIKVLKHGSYLLFLVLAVISGPVIGMSCQMVAMTLAPVGIVTALSQVSPVLLLPVDKFVLKKRIGWASVVGTCISIAGVGMLFL